MDDIIADLYSSEINFCLSTFWDSGYAAQLGDAINGYSEEVYGDTFPEVVEQLKIMAIEQYPDSEFTKKYREK